MSSLGITGVASETPRYKRVASSEAFLAMLEALHPARRMAIDIEADSLYHYFEKVCLIQVSTDGETYVLDPLAVRDLGALAPLMADSGIEKVFHAATYDIHCLRRDYAYSFVNIFDTHAAAQIVGHEQLGLSALMEKLLGVAHSKRRQRDDWSRRPLEAEQLEYAAMDTHHLLRLRDVLDAQLREKGRRGWAQEEFDAAVLSEIQEREFDPDGYRRIKGYRDLSLGQLGVLRALYVLRDRYARELDVPPFKVLNNPVLIDLARRPPRSPREMFRRSGISYRVARRYSGEIFRVIEKARSDNGSSITVPGPKMWKAPSREMRMRLDALKLWRSERAASLGLPVGVVFPGNLLENLAAAPPADLSALETVDGMRRWRAREFGPELLRILGSAPTTIL
jgi:ribonuclease D